MVCIRQCILTVIVAATCLGIGVSQPAKFLPDDPIQAEPKPAQVGDVKKLKIYELFDYLYQTGRQKPRALRPAMGVNTLGEVPDSAWFTNRHGKNRMTRDALKRGPGNENAPQPPFVIIGAKTEGITPGFRMRDAAGRLYFVKADPPTNPELSTGADVIGSKFFYAIGYNTPENYITRIGSSNWTIDRKAKITGADGISRAMVRHDMHNLLAKTARLPDGSTRIAASLAVPGRDLGPFRYEGTRSDDPNDIIPHEDRRDLRGLFVFCAWLNHTDAKAANSLNALVQESGISFIRHYLIDFGSALGSDGDAPKDARFGNAYQIPMAGDMLRSLLGLGFYSPRWERAVYPKLKAAGRVESTMFDPERWKANYPNPAFLSRLPDDEFWAAKVVLAFTDDDIRALLETGEFGDPRVVDYLEATLVERRNKIGRTYFSKVLPLDQFRVDNGVLLFEDLAVQYRFAPAREYMAAWSVFNNTTGTFTTLPGERSFHLPGRSASASDADYFAATIHAPSDDRKTVTVYVRKEGAAFEIVGIERKW
jgi:hypothetical protein